MNRTGHPLLAMFGCYFSVYIRSFTVLLRPKINRRRSLKSIGTRRSYSKTTANPAGGGKSAVSAAGHQFTITHSSLCETSVLTMFAMFPGCPIQNWCGRARASCGRQDFVGFFTDRSHDHRLPRSHQRSFRHAELQHDTAVDVQDRQTVAYPADPNQVHGTTRKGLTSRSHIKERLTTTPASLVVHARRISPMSSASVMSPDITIHTLLGSAKRS